MAAERWTAFWTARAPRERLALVLAAAVVGLALAYVLIYEPLAKSRAALEKRLPATRAEARLMQAQVIEIERLRKQAPTPGQASLVGRLNATAAARGLRAGLAEIGALDAERARVAGSVPLAAWLDWLAELEGQGVRVVTGRIVPGGQGGTVTVEAVFSGAAP
jgi:general secretion pathway protein M